MSIAVTALKEKIRRKELYIVSIIGVLILLFLVQEQALCPLMVLPLRIIKC